MTPLGHDYAFPPSRQSVGYPLDKPTFAVRTATRRMRRFRSLLCALQAADYARVSLIPSAVAARSLIDAWMEDDNTVHPYSRLGCRSPREYIMLASRHPDEDVDRLCGGRLVA